MTIKRAVVAAALAALPIVPTVSAQQGAAQPPLTPTVATAIPGVIAAGTQVQILKQGFMGTEGPIALPDGTAAFCETNASRIVRIDAAGTVTTYMENTNGSNALGFDPKGRLISVQTMPGNTRVGVIAPKSSEATLATGFAGRPNDLVVTSKGAVYFTVPAASVVPGTKPPTDPFPTAVYYIPPGGNYVKAAEGITFPNGIQLSRDEKTLYINNTQGEYILAFDVQADGTLTNRRDFGKYQSVTKNPQGGFASGADGLAIDNDGRVYTATPTGAQVFGPKGEYLGTIPTPNGIQNLAFAGPDKKTLYMVGRGAAYRVEMVAQGFKGRAK